MVGRVEYDQLVKYIRTVPQSMVRQCELQKQRLGLVAIMEFVVRYFMLSLVVTECLSRH